MSAMSSVRAQRLAFSYADAVELFHEVEFHLTPGWTGLVGANGAGKSTLLQLLAGALTPTDGSLRVEPEWARVWLCPQRVEALAPEVAALGEATDAVSRRVSGQLRLDPGELARWPTLSPGERKRWQIGAALAAEPEVLLLDEPTNHLDADGRDWLIAALRRFRGVGVLVSHDRVLLEALTHATLRLHGGGARLWTGPYETARREWEAARAGEQAAWQSAKDEQRKLKQRLVEKQRDRESAERERSTKRRMKDRNDSDARTLGAANLAEWAEGRLGRQASILRRATERADAAVGAFEHEKEVGRSIFVDYQRAPHPLLFTLDVPELRRGEARILGPVRLDVAREARIRIEGPNGAGKSTLLAALLAHARVPAERLLYLPQDLDAEEERAALEAVRALPPDARGRVLSLVAALGVEPAQLLASAQPSPGEARKLRMAFGLGQHAWGLVLDEPTNHLDLPSIERLEAALAAYPGALLLATHDAAFAARCTTSRWRVEGGAVTAVG